MLAVPGTSPNKDAAQSSNPAEATSPVSQETGQDVKPFSSGEADKSATSNPTTDSGDGKDYKHSPRSQEMKSPANKGAVGSKTAKKTISKPPTKNNAKTPKLNNQNSSKTEPAAEDGENKPAAEDGENKPAAEDGENKPAPKKASQMSSIDRLMRGGRAEVHLDFGPGLTPRERKTQTRAPPKMDPAAERLTKGKKAEVKVPSTKPPPKINPAATDKPGTDKTSQNETLKDPSDQPKPDQTAGSSNPTNAAPKPEDDAKNKQRESKINSQDNKPDTKVNTTDDKPAFNTDTPAKAASAPEGPNTDENKNKKATKPVKEEKPDPALARKKAAEDSRQRIIEENNRKEARMKAIR